MFFLKNLLLLVSATNLASAIAVPRANDPFTSLKIIDNVILKCSGLFDAFTGTGSQTATIVNSIGDLKNKIKQATIDVNAYPVLTDSQCRLVLSYLANPLTPDLQSLLKRIQGKKAVFVQAGYKDRILNDLIEIKKLFSDLLNALYQKMPASCRPQYKTYQSQIETSLQQSITYYS